MIDESWEYWMPDAECDEILRAEEDRVVRMAKGKLSKHPLKEFMFAFAGSDAFATGRFFDGIGFDHMQQQPVAKPLSTWFSWNINKKSESYLVSKLECALQDISRQARQDWLVSAFASAWDNLPVRLNETMGLLLTSQAPERVQTHKGGRPFSIVGVVAKQLGRKHQSIWRDYRRTKLHMLLSAIPPEYRDKCECGCGGDAPIAYVNSPQYGHKAGRPARFIHSHRLKGPRAMFSAPMVPRPHQGL